jgi:hypothetical protein
MPESGPGSRDEGAVPAARTPIADALLDDLIKSYGPSEASTVAAAPALIDPVAAPKVPTGAGAEPGSYGSPGMNSGRLGPRY